MPAMTEIAQVGKRQEIADKIWNIQPEATPVLSSLKKGPTPKQMLATWQSEAYPDVSSTPEVDGKPVQSYERVDRHLLQGYGHYFRRSWAVTTLADLTEVAGVGRDEAGRQLAASMLLMKRMIEQQILSNDDTQADNGTVGYGMRGMFKWLSASAQSVLPVPSAIRPAATNSYTGAFASFNEAALRAMFTSMFKERKSELNLTAYFALTLREVVDDWTNVYADAPSTSQPRTQYTVVGNQELINNVTRVKFTSGQMTLHTSDFLNRDTATGAVQTYSSKSGVIIDPTMWDIAYMKNVANTNLPPDGSGKRGFVDAVAVLRCFNPLAQGYVLPSS